MQDLLAKVSHSPATPLLPSTTVQTAPCSASGFVSAGKMLRRPAQQPQAPLSHRPPAAPPAALSRQQQAKRPLSDGSVGGSGTLQQLLGPRQRPPAGTHAAGPQAQQQAKQSQATQSQATQPQPQAAEAQREESRSALESAFTRIFNVPKPLAAAAAAAIDAALWRAHSGQSIERYSNAAQQLSRAMNGMRWPFDITRHGLFPKHDAAAVLAVAHVALALLEPKARLAAAAAADQVSRIACSCKGSRGVAMRLVVSHCVVHEARWHSSRTQMPVTCTCLTYQFLRIPIFYRLYLQVEACPGGEGPQAVVLAIQALAAAPVTVAFLQSTGAGKWLGALAKLPDGGPVAAAAQATVAAWKAALGSQPAR